MKKHKLLWGMRTLMINSLLIFVGCALSSPTPTPSGESLSDVSTIAVSRAASTPTLLPATPTPSATPTLTSTPGIMPIPTERPTTTETLAAIPTPPGSDIRRQVLWLFETNNGCQLPCWWGITPGQTEWSIAEEFLYKFDSNSDIYETSSAPGMVYYGISITLPPQIFTKEYAELGVLVKNGIVEVIQTDVSIGDTPPGYLSRYALSAFLATYGKPTEVWLSAHSSAPGGGPGSGGILPFVVVLLYPDQGIAAIYDDLGERTDDRVHGCPQAYPVSTLALWDSSLDLIFEELVSSSSAFNRNYLSLEEATAMDVATFYETFKNPDNTTCLETPADLWR